MKKLIKPLSLFFLFSATIAVGGRSPESQKNLPKTSSIDSIRAKNSLTLQKIEEKMKTYELKNKDN